MCWCWDDEVAVCRSPVVGRNTPGVLMDTLDMIAVVVGSVLLVGSLIVVVVRELWTHPERRLVGRGRDSVEVLLPALGALALVAAIWISVA
jgi:hypothetical protein